MSKCIVALAGVFVSLAVSGGVFVETSPLGSLHWETLFKRVVRLPVVWPEGATAAMLTVTDLEGNATQTAVGSGDSSVSWSPLAPEEIPSEDKLYTLVLSFTDSQQACVGAETARVAVVRSVFAGTCDLVKCDANRATRVASAPVFAYDSAWVGGTTNESVRLGAKVASPQLSWSETRNNVSGWFGNYFTNEWSATKPTITCDFSEEDKMSAAVRFPIGMCLIFQ